MNGKDHDATSGVLGVDRDPLSPLYDEVCSTLGRRVRDLRIDTPSSAQPDRVKAAIGTAYMGIICSNCGSDKVIRAGACGVCTQCGTSQGCS